MAATFMERGHRIVSGGTDNHLMLLDLIGKDYTGKECGCCAGRGVYHGQQKLGAKRSPLTFRDVGLALGDAGDHHSGL